MISYATRLPQFSLHLAACVTINFIIGGSYGVSQKVRDVSQMRLSFSKMTFPHQLMRLILTEQIYRWFSIINNGKYHK
jgi:23S rRNA (pseudouridine1915-N3)-methyltransferase